MRGYIPAKIRHKLQTATLIRTLKQKSQSATALDWNLTLETVYLFLYLNESVKGDEELARGLFFTPMDTAAICTNVYFSTFRSNHILREELDGPWAKINVRFFQMIEAAA